VTKIEWSDEQDQFNKNVGEKEKETEEMYQNISDYVDYVSPYAIYNQTGYPLEFEMELYGEKYYVKPFETININIRNFILDQEKNLFQDKLKESEQYRINL
jgi:hypothetical protein